MNPIVKLPFLLFDENIPKAKMNPVVRLPLLVLDNENMNKTEANPIVRLPLLVLDKENIKNSANKVKVNPVVRLPRLVLDKCLSKGNRSVLVCILEQTLGEGLSSSAMPKDFAERGSQIPCNRGTKNIYVNFGNLGLTSRTIDIRSLILSTFYFECTQIGL